MQCEGNNDLQHAVRVVGVLDLAGGSHAGEERHEGEEDGDGFHVVWLVGFGFCVDSRIDLEFLRGWSDRE